MKDTSRHCLLDLIRPFSWVHLYAAQPGALAMMREAEPVVRGSGRQGAWFADGWAVRAGRLADRPPERLPDFTPPGAATALFLGTQTTHDRTRQVIGWCRRRGIATLFVFDAWKNLIEPFWDPDGGGTVFPDVIIFPDDLALSGFQAALRCREPVSDPARLVVGGHWDIEGAVERVLGLDPGEVAALRARLNPDARPTFLLLLDPGDTAIEILDALATYLPAHHPQTHVLVKPHPREDRSRLEPSLDRWRRHGIDHSLVEGDPGPLIRVADQVWGMTTSALLIAREVGRPIRSLRPRRDTPDANPHLEPYLLPLEPG